MRKQEGDDSRLPTQDGIVEGGVAALIGGF
jgi:hypothetical protein